MREKEGSRTTRPLFLRPAAALATGLLLVLIAWMPGYGTHFAWFTGSLWLLPPFLLFLRKNRRDSANGSDGGASEAPAYVLLILAVLFLFTGVSRDPWFFLVGWEPEPTLVSLLVTGRPALFFQLTSLFFLLALAGKDRLLFRHVWLLLAAVHILIVWQLMSHTGGRALYQSDHPSFMFRLWAFGQTFPQLVFPNPLWNDGRIDPTILTSGLTGIGLLFYPLLKIFLPHQMYTPIFLVLFAALVPLAAGGSVLIAGGRSQAAVIAALLSLGISQFFFVWTLQYGTIGAGLSSAMIMPLCACLYRSLWMGKRETWVAIVLIVSGFLFFQWPPSLIMALPLAAALFFSFPPWNRSNLRFLLFSACCIAFLCLPMLLGILGSMDLGEYNRLGTQSTSFRKAFLEGWKFAAAGLRQGHPLLVFLGLGGIWFYPDKRLKRFYGTVLIGLIILTVSGDAWKPQYQLSRAVIPLFFLLTLPASLWVEQVLNCRQAAVLRAACAALLIIGGLSAIDTYGNRSRAHYLPLPDSAIELSKWIRENIPSEGRLLFAGAAVHEYGGGHVAYLPVLAGRKMMAVDYYHVSPLKYDYDYPPSILRENPSAFDLFADSHTVSHIITYDAEWTRFFRSLPDSFEEVYVAHGNSTKLIFRRRNDL